MGETREEGKSPASSSEAALWDEEGVGEVDEEVEEEEEGVWMVEVSVSVVVVVVVVSEGVLVV